MAAAYSLSLDASAALTRRVTWLSVATALILTALKAAVWIASGSVSILASLADSGLDLVAAIGSFVAVRYAVAPPDAEHRFGHGKAEAFASLVQAGLVFASAALVGQEAIVRLFHPQPVARGGWAIGAMAVSMALTGLLVAAQTAAPGSGRRPATAPTTSPTSPPTRWPWSPSPPRRCWASAASTPSAAWRWRRCCSGARSASSARPRTS
jgi:cation diffusion facilitator family transporter